MGSSPLVFVKQVTAMTRLNNSDPTPPLDVKYVWHGPEIQYRPATARDLDTGAARRPRHEHNTPARQEYRSLCRRANHLFSSTCPVALWQFANTVPALAVLDIVDRTGCRKPAGMLVRVIVRRWLLQLAPAHDVRILRMMCPTFRTPPSPKRSSTGDPR